MGRTDSFARELERNSKQLLEKYRSKAQSQAFATVKAISMPENAEEEILKAAAKEDIDMIVMGHRGLSRGC